MIIKNISSLYQELRRRHVVRVGLAYAVVGWLVIEVADLLTETYNAPMNPISQKSQRNSFMTQVLR